MGKKRRDDATRFAQVDKAWDAFDTYTGLVSSVVRNLCFVGLGFVLLLGGVAQDSIKPGTVINLSVGLVWAGSLLIGGLIADLLQYAYASAAFGIWARREEKRLEKPEAKATQDFPAAMNTPTLVLFWCKFGFATLAYVILLWHAAYAFA